MKGLMKALGVQGVFWPAEGDSLRVLVDEPEPASDHRMIWVDVRVP